jgi:hypothetical protein
MWDFEVLDGLLLSDFYNLLVAAAPQFLEAMWASGSSVASTVGRRAIPDEEEPRDRVFFKTSTATGSLTSSPAFQKLLRHPWSAHLYETPCNSTIIPVGHGGMYTFLRV